MGAADGRHRGRVPINQTGPGVAYTALVPNTIGLRRAIAAGVTEVAVFAAASETFSARNINQTVEESLDAYADVAREALQSGVRVRGYLSTAFGCPYEGAVPVGACRRCGRARFSTWGPMKWP